ncbi:NAD(P)(+) transhydrogenase (Re/Si-specific) subunit beta [Exilibacterium tricleocarpae]|uniref:NAD(P) transhydrogenase subunit beta n=1 Tax=Exilibacterium tricleocarpae TaxID=2591008 RepID=A0A545SMR3_9GAMM|nr:NAD(P)(+) transhydrogenase (Re/Si-specific) subunit beta [Exilibacterium tricleocarpae]TQV66146.1 NAD(P)(+) transhydrogenase (Re/Si-specific) subunit beta [Exilibacterium tricleocarpae]
MNITIVNLAYLLAAVLFILGIKGLTRPKTAVRGNMLSATGMLIAVVVTLLDRSILTYDFIVAGLVVGGVIGAVMALKVKMTAMPQMVALLNGSGGGASLGLAAASYLQSLERADFGTGAIAVLAVFFVAVTVIIGAVTLTGSLVAFAKLQEIIPGKPLGFAGMRYLNGVLFLASLAGLAMLIANPGNTPLFWLTVAVAAVLGLTLVLPIGGADMPVVIALLNSYSGIAAAAAGFIMGNTVLIIAGSLVGTSGLILTKIMCVAMNRSLTNVLFGVMGEVGESVDADEYYAGKIKSATADEVAMVLETARRVVIVPGFGMALSQAQHAVRELMAAMEKRDIEVEYAIHPVAGRMPGHMNVLLAEAEVPYEKLVEMDRINPTFEQTDVAIVIGANDVTNPMAREDKGSPIYGMPILNVDKAKTVIVIKRSLSHGFAGLPNPLFTKENTLMVFGDGKKAVVEMTAALDAA